MSSSSVKEPLIIKIEKPYSDDSTPTGSLESKSSDINLRTQCSSFEMENPYNNLPHPIRRPRWISGEHQAWLMKNLILIFRMTGNLGGLSVIHEASEALIKHYCDHSALYTARNVLIAIAVINKIACTYFANEPTVKASVERFILNHKKSLGFTLDFETVLQHIQSVKEGIIFNQNYENQTLPYDKKFHWFIIGISGFTTLFTTCSIKGMGAYYMGSLIHPLAGIALGATATIGTSVAFISRELKKAQESLGLNQYLIQNHQDAYHFWLNDDKTSTQVKLAFLPCLKLRSSFAYIILISCYTPISAFYTQHFSTYAINTLFPKNIGISPFDAIIIGIVLGVMSSIFSFEARKLGTRRVTSGKPEHMVAFHTILKDSSCHLNRSDIKKIKQNLYEVGAQQEQSEMPRNCGTSIGTCNAKIAFQTDIAAQTTAFLKLFFLLLAKSDILSNQHLIILTLCLSPIIFLFTRWGNQPSKAFKYDTVAAAWNDVLTGIQQATPQQEALVFDYI